MIIVDPLFNTGGLSPKWPYNQACHMMSDDVSATGEAELHAFAERLGLKRGWAQPGPHYDLTPTKRAKAVRLGAREIDRHEMATLVPAWRRYELAGLRPEVRHG